MTVNLATGVTASQAGARSRLSSSQVVLLALILCLALALRVAGLGFGLPAVYNPDEIAIMSRALAFATGDLNPHNFLYPSFYFYVLFGWLGLFFVAGWIIGAIPSVQAFQTQFFVDPSTIYLAGRALSVVCGVATVWLLFVLARRLLDVTAGLCAAFFLALAPAHMRDSHYVKHEVPVTLAIVLAMMAIVRLLRGRATTSAVVVAGAACGVAWSTHYYTVVLAVPLALALIWSRDDRGWATVARNLAIAFGAGAIVFFALSPFLLVEPGRAWNDIIANRRIVVDRAVSAANGSGAGQVAVLGASLSDYARMLWTESVGWPVLIASLVGLGRLMLADPRLGAVLASFPLVFLAFISNTVAASRYVTPITPVLALFAAFALSRTALRAVTDVRRVRLQPDENAEAGQPNQDAARQNQSVGLGTGPPKGGPYVRVAILVRVAIVVALALPAIVLSVRLGRFFGETDTRTVAQRWIEENVAPGATVLVQPYSVQLTQSREGLVEALGARLGDVARASTKFAIRLGLDPWPTPAYRTLYLGDGGLDADKIYVSYGEFGGSAGLEASAGLAVLGRANVDYVVLKRYNVEDPAVTPLRSLLQQRARLVVTFSPYRPEADARTRAVVPPFQHNTDTPYHVALARPGPGIEIWDVRPR